MKLDRIYEVSFWMTLWMTQVCLQLIGRTKPAGWGEKAGDLVAWDRIGIESVSVTESVAELSHH